MAQSIRTGNLTAHYAGIAIGVMFIAFLVDGGPIIRAKETVLKQNLTNMRNAIDQYTMDKQRAPDSLYDLVTSGYFRSIPVDPVTGEADWVTVTDETLMSLDQSDMGIIDVHSRSRRKGRDGSRYDTW
jgi:general secretion pathway protein G